MALEHRAPLTDDDGPGAPAPRDPRLRRAPVLLAAALWGLGLLLWFSPTVTPGYDAFVTGAWGGDDLCWPAIAQVLAPEQPGCRAPAAGAVGWGAGLMALAVPLAVAALLTPPRARA